MSVLLKTGNTQTGVSVLLKTGNAHARVSVVLCPICIVCEAAAAVVFPGLVVGPDPAW